MLRKVLPYDMLFDKSIQTDSFIKRNDEKLVIAEIAFYDPLQRL